MEFDNLVKECLEKGTARLELGPADQATVDRRRGQLHAAIIHLTPVAIEILTLPGKCSGDVTLVLRRFHA